MRRSFPFHDLGDKDFEDLVSAICQQILGPGAIVFADGKDGGRDGKFEGKAEKFPSANSPLAGKFIIQAKRTDNPCASCSDSTFDTILKKEKPKIIKLIKDGELEHYLIFTNRKKPATKTLEKENDLKSLGLSSAHIFGIEQLRNWLVVHPKVWSDLGFDVFEQPLSIQIDDITEIITAFHSTIYSVSRLKTASNFYHTKKEEKNRINGLSKEYFQEIINHSLKHFRSIEDFLKNPRNLDFKEKYEDTTDEIRRKLISANPPFHKFDDALTTIIHLVASQNPSLSGKRRFASIFMHYMYYNCDIGQNADTC